MSTFYKHLASGIRAEREKLSSASEETRVLQARLLRLQMLERVLDQPEVKAAALAAQL